MTKKELEKEAEEYALNQWEGNLPWSVIQKAYYDGALPREKRIEELEKELAISEHDREHNDYELTEVYKKIAELEAQIEKMKWHDLRKDPNDLPKGHKVVLNQVGMTTQYDPNRGFLGFGGVGIIAWCEIPLFKEIKEK